MQYYNDFDLIVHTFALQGNTSMIEVKDLESCQVLTSLTFESEISRMIFRLLGLYLGMLNSIANPILYAFCYPDF